VFGALAQFERELARERTLAGLQFVENLTDRQAADAVRGRIDWKYCLGMELEEPGFEFTVLSQYRTRLLAHGLDELALDMLLARLGELGLVTAGGKQRTDATHVLSAVRDLNRLELAGESVRAALEVLAVAGAALAGPGNRPRRVEHPLRAPDRFLAAAHLGRSARRARGRLRRRRGHVVPGGDLARGAGLASRAARDGGAAHGADRADRALVGADLQQVTD